MPAPNPVLELMRREFLDKCPPGSYQERIDLFEDFRGGRPILQTDLDPSSINQAAVRLLTGANRNWKISGTNAANAGSALDIDGGAALTTAGADNDQMLLSPADPINSVAQSLWRTVEWEPEHAPIMDLVVNLPSIENVLFQFGLTLTATLDLATDADQVKMQFSTEGAVSTTKWTACASIAGVDYETDTTIAAVAATSTRLTIKVDEDRIPTFWINGVKYVTLGALTAGVNFVPFVGIQQLAGSINRTMKVRSVRCNRLLV